ncbi:actin-related protein 6-like isoform X2 [Calliopsis andreniformis]|uniref:actin-related protein 6-like isoform X2 n=1 Tax=Calliopsis andreniformis TaxID=337506 RepID=UPI003FCE12D9
MDPMILPEEVWIKILLYCDVPDIIAFGRTCKYLKKTSDTEYLWRIKWLELISKVYFRFPDIKCLQSLNVSFKAMCYRLYMITTLPEGVRFSKCYHCSSYTCQRSCVESSIEKVVIEIGNKYTWVTKPPDLCGVITKHFSMFAVPKHINEMYVEQMQTHNASNIDSNVSGPFCIICNPMKVCRDKNRLIRHENDPSCYTKTNPMYEELINGYCMDAVKVLGISNVDLVSPAEALLKDGAFPVLKTFIDHLFHKAGLTKILREPNAVLMFCEPLAMHPTLRKQLLHYLFEEVKIARVCLYPKPLATCSIMDMDTCVVVDSGALKTTVAVVIGGRVIPKRWRLLPVGGWHVAYHLKQAMHWQLKEENEIPISYLDKVEVKKKCRLSYNIKNEEKPGEQKFREQINVPADWHAAERQFWRVSLGSELYIAPEMMYINLGLPQVIKDITSGLSEELLYDCLSNILLTGGNTSLSGFHLRLAKDLRELLPEYSQILEVRGYPGLHTWSAIGSTYVSLTVHPEGSPFWLSREEYVLFGCESLES